MSVAIGEYRSVMTGGWWRTAAATPATPSLTLANDGTGTSFTATVTGDAGVTHQVYYSPGPGAVWTAGDTRIGNGDIVQGGLAAGTRYYVIVISSLAGAYSLPSTQRTVYVVAAGSLPIIEQIAQNILTALLNLVADGRATSAERPLRTGLPSSPADKALYLYQDDPTEDEGPTERLQWLSPFFIDGYAKPSDTSVTPVDTEVNVLRADVEKAVVADRTFGGLAIDGHIRPPESFVTGEGFDGVRVHLDVVYRTPDTDPYSVG